MSPVPLLHRSELQMQALVSIPRGLDLVQPTVRLTFAVPQLKVVTSWPKAPVVEFKHWKMLSPQSFSVFTAFAIPPKAPKSPAFPVKHLIAHAVKKQ